MIKSGGNEEGEEEEHGEYEVDDEEEGEGDDEMASCDLLGSSEFMLKLILVVGLLMLLFASKELKANINFVSEVSQQLPAFHAVRCYLAQIKLKSGLYDETEEQLMGLPDLKAEEHTVYVVTALENAQHFARLALADQLSTHGRLGEAHYQLRITLAKAP